jgi:hypothetical protein
MFSDDPFGGKGRLILDTPTKRVWLHESSPGVFEQCTEEVVDPLIEANQTAYNDSEGKRWGDGQVVASIDLPTYFRKILPAKQNGDHAWIKRFLNDPDHRKYRTFKGRL